MVVIGQLCAIVVAVYSHGHSFARSPNAKNADDDSLARCGDAEKGDASDGTRWGKEPP